MRYSQERLEAEAAIREIFFAAMNAGYAGDAVKTTIAEFPGSKVIPFHQGDYSVYDCYFTAKGSLHSSGMTVIWHKSQPVWSMQYQGWYQPEAIPFLKRALRANYERGVFLGGRGPARFAQGNLKYHNHLTVGREVFTRFAGQEVISRIGSDADTIGWHEYQGMLLFSLEDEGA